MFLSPFCRIEGFQTIYVVVKLDVSQKDLLIRSDWRKEM